MAIQRSEMPTSRSGVLTYCYVAVARDCEQLALERRKKIRIA